MMGGEGRDAHAGLWMAHSELSERAAMFASGRGLEGRDYNGTMVRKG